MGFSLSGALAGAGAGVAGVGEEMIKHAGRSELSAQESAQSLSNSRTLANDRAEIEKLRDARLSQQRTDEHATNAKYDLVNLPERTKIVKDAEVAAKREENQFPAKALSPEVADEHKARADSLRANAEYTRGARTDQANSRALGNARVDAETNRQARVASSGITALMTKKDDSGAVPYSPNQITTVGNIAGQFVRQGRDPQEAANLASQAQEMMITKEQIRAKVEADYKLVPKTTFGGRVILEGGVEMKPDEWRKQHEADVLKRNVGEVNAWAQGQGIALPGSTRSDNQYADGNVFEKDGRYFIAKGGKPVPADKDGKELAPSTASTPATTEAKRPPILSTKYSPESMQKLMDEAQQGRRTQAAGDKVVADMNKEFQAKFDADAKSLSPQDLYEKYKKNQDGLTLAQSGKIRNIRDQYNIK